VTSNFTFQDMTLSMPVQLRFTLVADGSSDRALVPILRWALRQQLNAKPAVEFADLRKLPQRPRALSDRIARGVELYPCEILFVHRDAERETLDKRLQEIQGALESIHENIPWIGVVPIRMQEAWLLIDANALRKAADGTDKRLPVLPPIKRLEDLPDPKQKLRDLMRQAGGASGRKLKKFNRDLEERIQRLAETIDDFSPLRQLSAFQRLEKDIQEVLKDMEPRTQR